MLVHILTHELISFVNWTAHAWEDGRASCSVNPRWQGKCEQTVSLSISHSLTLSLSHSLFSLFSLSLSLSTHSRTHSLRAPVYAWLDGSTYLIDS